jgi:hypothetical protein
MSILRSKSLYQKTSIGRIIEWTIIQDCGILTYKWGYLGSDNLQTQIEEVKPSGKNGTLAYKDSEAQATLVYDRKIKSRKLNGFFDTEQSALVADASQDFKFNPFPTSFAPAKPIAEKPTENKHDDPQKHRPNKLIKDLIAHRKLIAQRKANGIRAFYVRFENQETVKDGMFEEECGRNINSKMFSRKIKDMSEHFIKLKNHIDLLPIPENTILDIEITLGGGFTDEEFTIVNSMTPNTKSQESNSIYNLWLKNNPNKPLVGYLFDIIFWNGENVYKLPYEDRLTYMQLVNDMNCKIINLENDNINSERIHVPMNLEIYNLDEFERIINLMTRERWEGLVLKDLSASCEFWLNGKPKRPKGNWKWKNTRETDCFVIEVLSEKGDDSKAGSLTLGQYLVDGSILHCGNAGSGLNDNDASSAWSWVGRVVTIQYDYRLPKNTLGERCFRNPRVCGLHPDKTKDECIFEEK